MDQTKVETLAQTGFQVHQMLFVLGGQDHPDPRCLGPVTRKSTWPGLFATIWLVRFIWSSETMISRL